MNAAAEHGYVPLNEHAHSGHAKLLDLVGSGKRVLDVGCSSGYLARPLVARGCTVVGLELDPEAAAEARTVCEEVLSATSRRWSFPSSPGSFDVVLCGDLIEHLRDPEAFLSRMRPLLRNDGRLVLTTPNVANWAMRLGLLARPLAIHGARHPRSHAHASLHPRDARRDARARRATASSSSTSPSRSPSRGRRRSSASRTRSGSLRPPLFAYQFVVAAEPRPLIVE